MRRFRQPAFDGYQYSLKAEKLTAIKAPPIGRVAGNPRGNGPN
jgi:hypothetical protein